MALAEDAPNALEVRLKWRDDFAHSLDRAKCGRREQIAGDGDEQERNRPPD